MTETRNDPLDGVSVKWYQTPEEAVAVFWAPVIADHGDPSGWEMGGVTEDGEHITFTPEQEIAGIKKQGAWGFCDTRNRVLHLWAASSTSADIVAHMVGHELAHLLAEDCPPTDHPELEDELFAEAIGDLCGLVTTILAARPRTPSEQPQFSP